MHAVAIVVADTEDAANAHAIPLVRARYATVAEVAPDAFQVERRWELAAEEGILWRGVVGGGRVVCPHVHVFVDVPTLTDDLLSFWVRGIKIVSLSIAATINTDLGEWLATTLPRYASADLEVLDLGTSLILDPTRVRAMLRALPKLRVLLFSARGFVGECENNETGCVFVGMDDHPCLEHVRLSPSLRRSTLDFELAALINACASLKAVDFVEIPPPFPFKRNELAFIKGLTHAYTTMRALHEEGDNAWVTNILDDNEWIKMVRGWKAHEKNKAAAAAAAAAAATAAEEAAAAGAGEAMITNADDDNEEESAAKVIDEVIGSNNRSDALKKVDKYPWEEENGGGGATRPSSRAPLKVKVVKASLREVTNAPATESAPVPGPVKIARKISPPSPMRELSMPSPMKETGNPNA
ncbi:uncharacterized protein MICPUCDRAFT_60832 [Micromonas pusilla CCMP1545]|jgi:hypothetical protein|uniref:Predicted protein n=1 Tax=Micromonas pusilla (strain CCMP1545) TaxID=564608 RepID=C1MZS2_MICPC|nr:uncharacterized protein MICPUCDRAFT_60832 [Micromonas pusilla CCMP1545]EEH54918.1 predicted protein [Micromonas pusilla CCMP1545]|eukprot:XP_003061268.1 predicted protein [Micromonas pusilla CCMP1545]